AQQPEKPGQDSNSINGDKKKANLLKLSTTINIIFVILLVAGSGSGYLLHLSDTSPQFCASCHNMSDHVDSYLNSNHMDNVHSQANVECKECHFEYSIPDEIVSGVKYVTGNYDKDMPRRKVGDEMCVKCHINLDYHAVRTDYLTRNPHLSHWPDIRCTACHVSHGEQVDYCSECHDNGGQRMTEDIDLEPRAENPWANQLH
nr:cytochrome c3 family protein [Anaerolineaceae bacterium]